MTAEPNILTKLDAEGLSSKSTSMWQTTLHRLFRRRSAVAGLIILGILVLTAIFAPLIAPYDPTISMLDMDPPQRIKARTAPCIHLLGCPADQPQHLAGIDEDRPEPG